MREVQTSYKFLINKERILPYFLFCHLPTFFVPFFITMLKLNCEDYPPFYKNAVENLILNLSSENEISQQKQLFEEFSDLYSVTPDLWKLWIGLVL